MNIVIGTVVLIVLACGCWQRLETTDRRAEAMAGVRRMTLNTLPLLIIALVSAGLFAELLPEALVRTYLGEASGLKGVLIGTVLGIVTPGGAFVSFVLAAGAIGAGATYPAIIAYVAAWGLLAITKLLAEEMVFLGPKFILTRALFCVPIPVACGSLSLLIG